MSGGENEEAIKLEFTPTWIVALVCSVIVFISLVVERLLHFLGKFFKKKNQKPLYEALLKVKEELMLLGFISLLMAVLQASIRRICIREDWTKHMLPCAEKYESEAGKTKHFVGVVRHLLSSEGAEDHCTKKGKVPLLSEEALHQLHIFIFVLALTHVIFSALTILFAGAKIRQWKHWEDSIHKNDTESVAGQFQRVDKLPFIQNRYKGIGKDSFILSWFHSFVKQFYGSVTESDYTTMRFGFIMTHCRANPKFNFHKYMVRALEADFKKVVGISWYLWIFVMVFLLLNVNGWHTYFWIAFIPLILLLALGTKLEQIITQLAHKVAEKHSYIEGELVVNPSDEHFWFDRPRIVLHFIHFILFQNAFEIAFFFWILTTYGWHSCIMGKAAYIIPRLIIGAVVQILCSYSTLPLYAIVTQMGTSFKKEIFEQHVQDGLIGWAQKAKHRKGARSIEGSVSHNNADSRPRTSADIQMQELLEGDKERVYLMEEGKAGISESK